MTTTAALSQEIAFTQNIVLLCMVPPPIRIIIKYRLDPGLLAPVRRFDLKRFLFRSRGVEILEPESWATLKEESDILLKAWLLNLPFLFFFTTPLVFTRSGVDGGLLGVALGAILRLKSIVLISKFSLYRLIVDMRNL